MKLSRRQLRSMILESYRLILKESELQKMLNLGHKFTSISLYKSMLTRIGEKGLAGIPYEEKEFMTTALRNRMVKEQIGDKHPAYENFDILLNMFDPDRSRRQAYRKGVEDEMRELDSTGSKQKSGVLSDLERRGY